MEIQYLILIISHIKNLNEFTLISFRGFLNDDSQNFTADQKAIISKCYDDIFLCDQAIDILLHTL